MAYTVGEGGNVAGSAAANSIRNAVSNIQRTSRTASRTPVKKPVVRKTTSNTRTTNNNNTRTNYRPARPVSYTPPRPAVGSTSRGTVTPTRPAPPPMSIDEWLARGNDTVYNDQQSAYKRALADYAAQYKAEQDKYGQEYEASLQKLQTDQDLGGKSLQDDYAGRGLLQSGVYAQALSDFQNQYQTRRDDLGRARTAYLNDLTTDKTNFEQEQALALARAKQEAANRRTAQLGL